VAIGVGHEAGGSPVDVLDGWLRFSCLGGSMEELRFGFANTFRAIISSWIWPSVAGWFVRSLSSMELGTFLSLSNEPCLCGMARSPGSRWPVITAGSGGRMNVGSGFFGFFYFGG